MHAKFIKINRQYVYRRDSVGHWRVISTTGTWILTLKKEENARTTVNIWNEDAHPNKIVLWLAILDILKERGYEV